ncbi:SPOR domain-containing protein [Vibrio alfacsensis]|uniref:SPOR domain-containing protein n=1 Tax=Vibrio alfacsensis TaxID=1074311 RepID=UPI001BF0781D|nr:SPOR domain-containing protein [Vibrio alfacsensis]BCN26106.1 cytochrome c biogenesis protein CcdA [Vibrio alfacsensis]
MKKISIIGLTVLLSACASETYITDVSTESYREDYQSQAISKPVMSTDNVVEEDVKPTYVETTPKPEQSNAAVQPPKEQAKPVQIVPPSEQQAAVQRFGYTIQVVAVGSQAKVDQFARQLPQNDQPIWENYKIVNGTKWFSVLYGDYATSAEAKQAIMRLPEQFQQLKPFVKSIDAIKNSAYPTLNKLN